MFVTPLAKLEWPPTYAEGHTRNIHRCTIFARPAPWVFHTTHPGGGFRPPPGTEHPRGVCKHPPGLFRGPLRVQNTPGCT